MPRIIIVLALTAALAASAAPTGAAATTPIGVQTLDSTSGYVDVELPPGETHRFNLALTAAQPTTAAVAVVDAHTQPGGGLRYQPNIPSDARARDWVDLDLDSSTVDIDPNTPSTVSGTISVPNNTLPGDYVAGVVITDAADTAGPTEGTLGIETRGEVTIALHVRVPGDAPHSLTIDGVVAEVQRGWINLVVDLTNDGALLIEGQGTVDIAEGPVLLTLDTHHPGDTHSTVVRWADPDLPAGCHDATVEVNYLPVEGGETRTARWTGCVDVPESAAAAVDPFETDDDEVQSAGGFSWWWLLLAAAAAYVAGRIGRTGPRPQRRRVRLAGLRRRRDDEEQTIGGGPPVATLPHPWATPQHGVTGQHPQ